MSPAFIHLKMTLEQRKLYNGNDPFRCRWNMANLKNGQLPQGSPLMPESLFFLVAKCWQWNPSARPKLKDCEKVEQSTRSALVEAMREDEFPSSSLYRFFSFENISESRSIVHSVVYW